MSLQKEIQALAVGIPTKITYFLKNIHEEMLICDVSIRDNFSPNMKFEVIHRKEIEVDETILEEELAYDEVDEIDWFDEEDPDANVEIHKEVNVINLTVEQPIYP